MKPFFRYFLLTITATLLSLHVCKAQHCAWDYYGIMVAEIKADMRDSTVIKNLKITLLDSLDKPIVNEQWDIKMLKYISDTTRFWQNPDSTTIKGYIDNANPFTPQRMRFWFAGDNYVCVTYYSISKPPRFRLKIEDIDGDKNGGSFQTKIVPLEVKDFYPLCNHFSNWDSGPQYGFVKGFKPVLVILKKIELKRSLAIK